MTYNNLVMEKQFEILKDPRVPTSQEGYENQLEFLLEVKNEVSKANQSIIQIREIKKDMNYILSKTKDNAELQNLVNVYINDLSIIENKIHMTKNQSRQDPLNYGIRINNRLAFLLFDSQRGDYPPTNQAFEFFNEIKRELEIELSRLKDVIITNKSIISSYMKENNINLIISK